ncbi:head decoration protein [Stella sp.]|uniref:head decoration protein n=1 Tax=Stella sp. TaxID=2912054 RepID=UPI0035AF8E23
MPVLALPAAAGDWLKHESDPRYVRDPATIASTGSARIVPSGTVLGRIALTTPAAGTAAGGNIGNGALGTVAVGPGAEPGVYRLELFQAAANGGAFAVTGPDGRLVGIGRVGVAFAGGGLAFTLADGASDFAAGDAFAITVAAGSGKLVELDPAGALGTAVPAAVLVDPVAVPAAGDALALVLARGPALVRADGLAWPESYEADDIAAGLARLAHLGIVARTGA